MKKIVAVACAAVLLALLSFSGCARTIEQENEGFTSLYQTIRDLDFVTGHLEGNTAILYNAQREELVRLELAAPCWESAVALRKDAETDQIYFILGGSVDDECGILYTAGSTVDMDGLYVLNRLGGNCFYYQTYK